MRPTNSTGTSFLFPGRQIGRLLQLRRKTRGQKLLSVSFLVLLFGLSPRCTEPFLPFYDCVSSTYCCWTCFGHLELRQQRALLRPSGIRLLEVPLRATPHLEEGFGRHIFRRQRVSVRRDPPRNLLRLTFVRIGSRARARSEHWRSA